MEAIEVHDKGKLLMDCIRMKEDAVLYIRLLAIRKLCAGRPDTISQALSE